MSGTTGGQWRWLLPCLVGAVVMAAFLPVLGNGFVNWDDDRNFTGNPDYRGLGSRQLRWMLTAVHMGHYTPITWLTLGLDFSLWGMDAPATWRRYESLRVPRRVPWSRARARRYTAAAGERDLPTVSAHEVREPTGPPQQPGHSRGWRTRRPGTRW